MTDAPHPDDFAASRDDLARELEDLDFSGPDPEDYDRGPPIEDLAPDDPGGDDPGGDAPGGTGRPRGQIWDGCQVIPLGVNGDSNYYLDRHGQLRAVKKHEAGTIMHLFGDKVGALCRRFPQWTAPRDGGTPKRKKNRFDAQNATMAMIAACSEKGLFNPDGAVRGVGAWTDDDGALVYHCGTHVLIGGRVCSPGEHDGRIYPAYPAIPAPAEAVGRVDAARIVLETAASWRYEHQDVMPMIILGVVGTQMLGGALDWRPVTWITGDKAYGKSSLQEMIKLLHGGDKGVIKSADATKSGITSQIGHSSLPVAIDELEPGEDSSRKEADIVALARIAASGDKWLRGSADQKGAWGNVYSSFLFSSILIPGVMGPQDRSRLITVHLRPLEDGSREPRLDPRTWRGYGATLKRVLINRWPSWRARMDLWHAAVTDIGVGGRPGKNWATVLAMADMALHEELPSAEHLAGWAHKVASAALRETSEIGSDADSMLMWLLGQLYDPYRRGEQWTIAQWIMTAAQLPSAPPALVAGDAGAVEGTMIAEDLREAAAKRANASLAKVGLRVRGAGEGAALFIANAPIPGLKKLFEGSTWGRGEWAQSARRIVGAEPVDQPLTLAGQRSRGVYVPLRHVGGMMAFPMDRAPVSAPAMPDGWEADAWQ